MTKTQAISKMLLEEITRQNEKQEVTGTQNNTLQIAIDKILGEGAYDKLVGDLYEELRAIA